MKTFRDLYIRLNGRHIDDLVAKIAFHCHEPWSRVSDNDVRVGLSNKSSYCFFRKEKNGVPAAKLYLFDKDNETWYVSNIVPKDINELTYDQYNEILLDFYSQIVSPALKDSGAEVRVTEDHISIQDVAGKEVLDALIGFSNSANKSTGSSHPMDRERWFEFLVLANEAGNDLHFDLVVATLIELGWSEEGAYELGIEFEFAEGLLSYIKGR